MLSGCIFVRLRRFLLRGLGPGDLRSRGSFRDCRALFLKLTNIVNNSRGALPRQLALEYLDSIQKILFPLSDPKSRALLLSLTTVASFDPDCLRFESASIRNADETDVEYHYLGTRLLEFYEEIENPTPRGWVEKWLERKSGARYVMLATLVGVVIAVVLGMASLAVGSYQAWVGYQQWQHPVGG